MTYKHPVASLLVALAVTCTVMYLTADGESILKNVDAAHSTGSGQDVIVDDTLKYRSEQSTDVLKTGLLYTKTPDTQKQGPEGRQRLLTFLDKIEANIAKEIQSRKKDIAAIRVQMAKNMAYNAEARKKMKSMLLAKMAVNAKKAKDDLAEAMRQTQEKFAKAASLENKRQRQTMRRAKKTREIMRKNKKEGAKQLAAAVENQQRALATLDSATNARIKKSNKAIAANAAQIKENAKKARKDLEAAMGAFDKKMANIHEEAQKGRSKLAAQAAAQDKKFRQWANNKVKAIAAKTSAQFHKVRDTMSKDRHHADQALAHTSARMDAALNAAKALQDKRFAQTVSDIAEAKKEANDRVNKFKTSFKADILHLSGVVSEQSNKLNTRMTQLAGTVASNREEQAHLNSQVDAELKRMVKVGNDRYAEHLKKDKELHDLMARNKEDTAKHMSDMAKSFYAQMAQIKAQMKKDRSHAESQLSSSTDALYKTLGDNMKAQDAVNKALTAATRRAKLDAAAALKEAKEGFTSKVAKLHEVVKEDEKKHNKKVMDLTGVVAANAVKDAQGRAELKKISEFNKNQMKKSVADAVHKGEQRALQIEKKMKDVNAKTRSAMNMRITTEISKLSKSIHTQIDELNMQTKEARAQMKAEILFAVKSEAKIAKDNLKKTVEWAEGEFSKLNSNLQAEKKLSEGERTKLDTEITKNKASIIAQVEDAVATQNAALVALTMETQSEITKMDKGLTAQVDVMLENNKNVRDQMKADTAALVAGLEAARKSADQQLEGADAASVARYNEVVKAVEDGVESARVKADKKFGAAYETMLEDRKKLDEKLAGAVSDLNDSLAKNSAIQDERFSKTVKDIKSARAEATKQVEEARAKFKALIYATTATAKQTEGRILGGIQLVSGMVVSDRAAQIRINSHVEGELQRVLKKSNDYQVANKRGRATIDKVIEEYKHAAAQEVEELSKEAMADTAKLRHEQHENLFQFKMDVSEATESVYETLFEHDQAQHQALGQLHTNLHQAQVASAASLKNAEEQFHTQVEGMANEIFANAQSFERGYNHLTQQTEAWKHDAEMERDMIKIEQKAMFEDLKKNIARAVMIGEAKQKAVEEEANLNINKFEKESLPMIAEKVENMADNVFKTIQEDRGKVADNFLSLIAYAKSAADKIIDVNQNGKGRSLSSIGDLLQEVSTFEFDAHEEAELPFFGANEIPMIFSGESVAVDTKSSTSQVNLIVQKYQEVLSMGKQHWPMGLGHYLLTKLEVAMTKAGVLEVDKVEGGTGKYVFINSQAVGLSSHMDTFQKLAVRMEYFQKTLAKVAASVHAKTENARLAQHKAMVPPPEWEGN